MAIFCWFVLINIMEIFLTENNLKINILIGKTIYHPLYYVLNLEFGIDFL